jgi:hypothetical protein
MPTDSKILGFSNRWYSPALENARLVGVGEHHIRLISAPYFLEPNSKLSMDAADSITA